MDRAAALARAPQTKPQQTFTHARAMILSPTTLSYSHLQRCHTPTDTASPAAVHHAHIRTGHAHRMPARPPPPLARAIVWPVHRIDAVHCGGAVCCARAQAGVHGDGLRHGRGARPRIGRVIEHAECFHAPAADRQPSRTYVQRTPRSRAHAAPLVPRAPRRHRARGAAPRRAGVHASHTLRAAVIPTQGPRPSGRQLRHKPPPMRRATEGAPTRGPR